MFSFRPHSAGRIRLAALLLLLLFLLPVGCRKKEEPPPPPEVYPVTVFGEEFTAPPVSMAVLAPHAAEALEILGFSDYVWAVSETCTGLSDEYLSVGSPLNPDIDAIIALKPELLIYASPLPAYMTEKLETNGIRCLYAPAPAALPELFGSARAFAVMMQGIDPGEYLYEEKISKGKEKFEFILESLADDGDLKTAFLIDDEGKAAVGSCFIDDLLTVGRLPNIYRNGENYLADLSLLPAADPDCIILSDKMDKAAFAENHPDLTAVKNGKIYSADYDIFFKGGFSSLESWYRLMMEIRPQDIKRAEAEYQAHLDRIEAERLAAEAEAAKTAWDRVKEWFFSHISPEKDGEKDASGLTEK